MNKKLLEKITEKFKAKLERKTGWGRNEVFQAYQQAVNEALFEMLDDE